MASESGKASRDKRGPAAEPPVRKKPPVVAKAPADAPAGETEEQLAFEVHDGPAVRTAVGRPAARRHKRSSGWLIPVLAATSMAMVAVGALLVSNYLAGREKWLKLAPIAARRVADDGSVQFKVAVDAKGVEDFQFSLENAPAGATINEQTGEFSWSLDGEQKPGPYEITIRVASAELPDVADQRQFKVDVVKAKRPGETGPIAGAPKPKPSDGPQPGAPTDQSPPKDPETAQKPSGPAKPSGDLDDEMPKDLSDIAKVEPQPGPGEEPSPQPPPPKEPDPPKPEPPKEPDQPKPDQPKPDPAKPKPGPDAEPKPEESADADGDQKIVDLYQGKKIWVRSEYAALRRIYAQRFERKHQAEIKQALGDDCEKMTAWLNEHSAIKEELFTAIDEKRDKLPGVLKIFQQLVEKFPGDVPSFSELAIAVAVTWDNERGAVYDYTHHQQRTRATMPTGAVGAIENFKYFVSSDKFLGGRARFLPWEFLVHTVNHRTPEPERQWAVVSYLPYRAGYGRCYKDVPYDKDMLNSEGKTTKLEGKPYTLENIRRNGGVCAMQADFAARVGKSIGVPAEYVSGESRGGELHAWVIWVEVKNATKDSIAFSIESYGRYRGDKYYVGNLHDPHTGEAITDRQLELRLHAVGVNSQIKRQTALVMKSFPMLRERLKMETTEQLNFLNQVQTRLCPWNEDCWLAIARLSKEGLVERQHVKAMMLSLEKLFTTFAIFPDFTWVVFDDLVSFQKDAKARGKLYERLVVLYESAGRPDLACEARLKYTDHLVADGKGKDAVEGLAFTIKKFSSEGRYVPKMLDKLEAICKDFKGADDSLIRFYKEFLPMVPPMRDDRPSPFCMAMYQRGADRFREMGQNDLAQMCEARLTQIKAGTAKK